MVSPCGQTNTCENITLPKLRLQAVKSEEIKIKGRGQGHYKDLFTRIVCSPFPLLPPLNGSVTQSVHLSTLSKLAQ